MPSLPAQRSCTSQLQARQQPSMKQLRSPDRRRVRHKQPRRDQAVTTKRTIQTKTNYEKTDHHCLPRSIRACFLHHRRESGPDNHQHDDHAGVHSGGPDDCNADNDYAQQRRILAAVCSSLWRRFIDRRYSNFVRRWARSLPPALLPTG